MQRITILGESTASGAYVLRMHVDEPLAVVFGRFQGGEPVALPPGEYIYVGSAMGRQGASSLPQRLLRHATRSAGRAPQRLRPELLAALAEANLVAPSARLPASKTLRWHVDYLLDESAATLAGVIALPNPLRHETALAQRVADDPHTVAPASGLGASDASGATHLQRIALPEALSPEQWWESLLLRLARQCTTSAAALRIDNTR
jgi:Uri superfamily endonuclease